MKKKTFIVQLLDSKKPSRTSFTQVEDANFYSNDTDASLVFIPHEDSFDFESAKVVMFNRGDESLVERDMVVTTEDGRKVASYELPAEIISHWGDWTAQPVFTSGGEIYSGSIVPFSVIRYLMHERPPKLSEIVTVTNFIQQSQALVDDMVQEETQRVTQEQDRQSSEVVRVQAEQERVQGYQEIKQIIEDGALNAEPADGSVTTDKLASKAVDLSKLNIIGYLPKSIEYNFEDAAKIRGLSQEFYLNAGDTITSLGKYSYVLYRIPSSGSTYTQAEWQSPGGWRTTDITIDTAGLYLIRTNPVAGGTLTDNDLVEMTNTVYIITSDTAVKRKELDDRLANFEGGGSGGVDESQVLQILSDSELINNIRTDIATLTNGLGVERVSSPLNLPFEILKIAGQYTTNLDVDSLKNPVSKRYYVDNVNGKYNNSGTRESPLESIWRAYGKSDCDEIVLLNDSYGWTTGIAGYPITRPINIIAEEHAVLGSFRENVIYTQDTTYPNVYAASERNIQKVVDLTDMDRPLNFEQVNSLEECASKRYSWFRPDNSQVYVNTGNGIPDDNIFLMLSSNAISVDDSEFYAENITFLNTVRSESTVAPKKRIVLNNCDIYLGITNNALTVLGSDAISINTSTQYADMDGFNYHINGDLLPTAIEINCSGRYNGLDGAGQNNGSTMHDGGTVIRIGGTYEQNNGPNVIDVNEGGKSLNVGVKAFRSKGISGTVSHADFRNGNIGMSDMWLIDCVSYGSEYSVVTRGGGRTIIEGGMIMGLIEEQ